MLNSIKQLFTKKLTKEEIKKVRRSAQSALIKNSAGKLQNNTSNSLMAAHYSESSSSSCGDGGGGGGGGCGGGGD